MVFPMIRLRFQIADRLETSPARRSPAFSPRWERNARGCVPVHRRLIEGGRTLLLNQLEQRQRMGDRLRAFGAEPLQFFDLLALGTFNLGLAQPSRRNGFNVPRLTGLLADAVSQ